MASSLNKLHTYAGLDASPSSTAHQLYFAPLEDLHSVFRTDGATNVVVVAFIGRTNHSKSLLANLMVDQTVFLVRHLTRYSFRLNQHPVSFPSCISSDDPLDEALKVVDNTNIHIVPLYVRFSREFCRSPMKHGRHKRPSCQESKPTTTDSTPRSI